VSFNRFFRFLPFWWAKGWLIARLENKSGPLRYNGGGPDLAFELGPELHIRMAGAHIFIEAGLDEDQRFFELSAILVFLVAQSVGRCGPLSIAFE
jgi:hypothetical protein